MDNYAENRTTYGANDATCYTTNAVFFTVSSCHGVRPLQSFILFSYENWNLSVNYYGM